MGSTKRGDFSIASKYATGMYLLAIAFFLYAASSLTARAGTVSSWWLVAGFAAQSLGELLISALGFSMVARLVPEHSRGIIMGAWFLGVGAGALACAIVATAITPLLERMMLKRDEEPLQALIPHHVGECRPGRHPPHRENHRFPARPQSGVHGGIRPRNSRPIELTTRGRKRRRGAHEAVLEVFNLLSSQATEATGRLKPLLDDQLPPLLKMAAR